MANARPAVPVSPSVPDAVVSLSPVVNASRRATRAPVSGPLVVAEAVLKGQAKRLLAELRPHQPSATLSQAQAMLARVWNEPDWHTLIAERAPRPGHGPGAGRADPTVRRTPWSLGTLDPRLIPLLLERWLADTEPMWHQRAAMLIRTVIPVLVEVARRDHAGQVLPLTLLDGLEFDALLALSKRRDLPANEIGRLLRYIQQIPGYGPLDVRDTAREQHGHLRAQVTPSLQTLHSLLPVLDTVVWRREWAESPAFEDATRFTWLDAGDTYSLQKTFLFGPSQSPVVRLYDLVERMAQSLSDVEVSTIRHWLNLAHHPGFVPQAEELDRLLSARPS